MSLKQLDSRKSGSESSMRAVESGDQLLTRDISFVHLWVVKVAVLLPIVLMVLVSCGGDKEDKALVAKYKEQQEVLDSLERELREVRLAISDVDIPDEVPNLKKMESELKKTIEKREALEADILALTAKKKKEIEDLEIYKKKYPIR
jgi:hypothetical protein